MHQQFEMLNLKSLVYMSVDKTMVWQFSIFLQLITLFMSIDRVETVKPVNQDQSLIKPVIDP